MRCVFVCWCCFVRCLCISFGVVCVIKGQFYDRKLRVYVLNGAGYMYTHTHTSTVHVKADLSTVTPLYATFHSVESCYVSLLYVTSRYATLCSDSL